MRSNVIDPILETLRRTLPRGGELPHAEFDRRHRWLLALLWSSAVVIFLYSLARGYPLAHSLIDASFPLLFGVFAVPRAISRRWRAAAAALGLSTAAAVGVHLSGGLIEAHFSFFVIVMLLTLYEDRLIYGLAVAFVLVHHGVMGMVDPSGVFSSPDQFEHPWRWAAIHATFVAMAGIGALLAWRLNEDIRVRMREAQGELARAAMTDALTGIPNRRALVVDLEDALASARRDQTQALLVLADLDGFKLYNDTFGHMAGDSLLQRLSRNLTDATAGIGTAYRLGGDEFCVLAPGGAADGATALKVRVEEALSEAGEGFVVASSSGSALIPRDATSASETLRVADLRMYAQKTGGRASAGSQSKDVLLRTLAESRPDLGRHLVGVAELARSVAERIGVTGEAIEQVTHAAALHDVGKVAIPDAILDKPGPLDEAEWEFMKRHTVIGERIVAAAPALAQVARIVRSTHEHWDGSGYPDGLHGSDIPLGARIVSVCDAFEAMVNERPYKAASNLAESLAELRRCSGTQFDPGVVAAFEQLVAEEIGSDQQAA